MILLEHRRLYVGCCADHGRVCADDPCCHGCSEWSHDFLGFITGTHEIGTPCAAPDLSDFRGA